MTNPLLRTSLVLVNPTTQFVQRWLAPASHFAGPISQFPFPITDFPSLPPECHPLTAPNAQLSSRALSDAIVAASEGVGSALNVDRKESMTATVSAPAAVQGSHWRCRRWLVWPS